MEPIRLLSRTTRNSSILASKSHMHQSVASRLVFCRPSHHSGQFHQSLRTSRDSTPIPQFSSPKSTPPAENPSLPSINLWHQIREARPAVRYTVYAGLGLMVAVESTFWFNVLKAKFFPSASEEEKEKADEFLGRIGSAWRATGESG